MTLIKNLAWLKTSAICSAVFLASAPLLAQEVDLSDPDAISNYVEYPASDDNSLEEKNALETDIDPSLKQVTNVNQLRDVSPTDWAYEALRSLVDRYGCIAGYPNQTYRGSQALTRYEFAAGLNACLTQIERLIASSGAVSQEDLDTMSRLTQEFEAELASLGGRLDNLENRTAFLEDNAFSTTTILQGEVAFTIANAFGDSAAADLNEDGVLNDDLDSEVVFTDRVRLQLVSSFTGEDKLFTRLTAGNIDNSFQDETGTREGRFAFDGQADNNITIDRLHYVFPMLEGNLQVTTMASLGAHHFYAETFNEGLDVGGGANGALTRFAERNPIYRQGIDGGSAGLGLNYTLGEKFEISAGYIAPTASDPEDGNGLFNGSYSALGQLVFKPFEALKVGATYVRGYDTSPFRGSFLWGGTGTNAANFRGLGVDDSPVTTNSFGGEFQFDVSTTFSVRGWFSYTDADILEDGDAEIFNYAGAVVVSDLVKEGSLAAIVVGAEPYVNDLNLDSGLEVEDDIPLHVEAFYKYQLNDNISITPGVVWLVSPNQDSDNDDIIIGALRTTFTF
ncbi:iron uptake porin [Myxosarcina sp. GI1]|uniref:iron uptake porin n=1 Tax=Myxosarcina sp. GI1 TaxID=1541065 RepID=UPI0005637009|nr:iron uptake porin [Myxosarcina sp. GI1]